MILAEKLRKQNILSKKVYFKLEIAVGLEKGVITLISDEKFLYFSKYNNRIHGLL